MEIRFYPQTAGQEKLCRFSIVAAGYGQRWIFCRHSLRQTWECPGGHIEEGETPAMAARRELFEETGAAQAAIFPVCLYSVTQNGEESFGMLFFAEVESLEPLPAHSEMAEIRLFSGQALPEKWTYPQIQPKLWAIAAEFAREKRKKSTL